MTEVWTLTPPLKPFPMDDSGSDEPGVTAAESVGGLRPRGFQVRLAEGRLVVSPGSRLSDADCSAVGNYKTAIVAVLRAEPVGQLVAPSVLCGEASWAWEPAWHRAPHRRDGHDDHHGQVNHRVVEHAVHDDHAVGEPEPVRGVWVCHTCISRPVPTLAIPASLTSAERAKLQAEADAGDRLGRMVLSGVRYAGAFVTGENIYAWHVVDDAAEIGEVTG